MVTIPESGAHPKASQVRSVLRALNATNNDIEAAAAVTTDGLIIGSVLGDEIDQDRFGAMSASLLALAERAAAEVARGQLKQVLIDGTSGLMLLVQAGSDAVLALAAKPTPNLGRVFIDARTTAEKINILINTSSTGKEH
ncbi:roadblock/LC7 domain-containing protein [Thiohalomonas denitrificans]|uniref:Roadblock/LAMTOR2 domain-containing protein n=1 Tax=Thiohalomonas denitrificans TaxID=415747 RepID=A0A1G5QBQ3_9GAMM|nr:roadblock/LC7 domain-containing protein [Thiohalomonas denitrificans]SCZ59305.1 hypothetical protein SAMN03097708_01835 [Thiohalomonas denitrificans]